MTQREPHRRSLHLTGVHHSAPIPLAARVGNMVFSSAIMGADPSTGKWPEDAAEQVKFAFRNMVSVIQLGGGQAGDIGRVALLIDNEGVRKLIDPVWLEWFPDEFDRPARHIVCSPLRSGIVIQIEFIAVLKPQRRTRSAS
jgi:2-iminobutanoate/2-iminopropanoate deaminase